MIRMISIIMAMLLALTVAPTKKTKTGGGSGIGTPAYHEPACGIGEAASHAPGGN